MTRRRCASRRRCALEFLESRTLLADSGSTFRFAASDYVAVESSLSAPGGGDDVQVTIVRAGDVSGSQTVWLDTPGAAGTAGPSDFRAIHEAGITFEPGQR